MNQKKTDLRNLAHLADIILERELERLSAVGRAIGSLEHEVRDLDQALEVILQGFARKEQIFVPTAAGYVQNWQRWRRQKRVDLTTQLATTKAEQEEIRASARLAFGRVQALRRISEDA